MQKTSVVFDILSTAIFCATGSSFPVIIDSFFVCVMDVVSVSRLCCGVGFFLRFYDVTT